MNNFQFENKMRPNVIHLLQKHAGQIVSFEESTEEQDTKQATDFIIVAKKKTIAARVRRNNCTYRDLTIRTRSRYGYRTEIDKLLDGWGDLYFYGWEGKDNKINDYILVDIQKMRESGFLASISNRPHISNGDGTQFANISIMELKQYDCLIHNGVTS